jgi:hypothetical protein
MARGTETAFRGVPKGSSFVRDKIRRMFLPVLSYYFLESRGRFIV